MVRGTHRSTACSRGSRAHLNRTLFRRPQRHLTETHRYLPAIDQSHFICELCIARNHGDAAEAELRPRKIDALAKSLHRHSLRHQGRDHEIQFRPSRTSHDGKELLQVVGEILERADRNTLAGIGRAGRGRRASPSTGQEPLKLLPNRPLNLGLERDLPSRSPPSRHPYWGSRRWCCTATAEQACRRPRQRSRPTLRHKDEAPLISRERNRVSCHKVGGTDRSHLAVERAEATVEGDADCSLSTGGLSGFQDHLLELVAELYEPQPSSLLR